jgi:hypothetical protein
MISVDVGIKNMAYCVFCIENNTCVVEDWNILNLSNSCETFPVPSCNFAKKKKTCMKKAKYPELLTFGICWQHAKEDIWDNLDEFKNRPQFTIMDVPWTESKGLGWARSNIQKMWKGETFTLQLDSHHRFDEYWDEQLIEMFYKTAQIICMCLSFLLLILLV